MNWKTSLQHFVSFSFYSISSNYDRYTAAADDDEVLDKVISGSEKTLLVNLYVQKLW